MTLEAASLAYSYGNLSFEELVAILNEEKSKSAEGNTNAVV